MSGKLLPSFINKGLKVPFWPLLWVFSKIFGLVVQLRNFAYDRKIFKIYKMPYPVVSVGNLTVGGTGKTPLIDFLACYAENKGLKVLIASRGYKSQNNGVSKVDPAPLDAPNRFGDEPVWLARKHPALSVYVGSDKVAVAQWIAQNHRPDALFVDDGFQHRRLGRDLDLLIIDATEENTEQNFDERLLPLGRWREPLKNLKRADAIILTKTNLATTEKLKSLEQKIRNHLTEAAPLPLAKAPSTLARVFHFPIKMQSLVAISSGRTVAPEQLLGRKVLLVSGIARPAGFFKLTQETTQAKIVDHLIFPDHYRFQKSDVESLKEIRLKKGAEFIILTEKDATKCARFFGDEPVLVAKVALEPSGDLTHLYDLLDRVICKSS